MVVCPAMVQGKGKCGVECDFGICVQVCKFATKEEEKEILEGFTK